MGGNALKEPSIRLGSEKFENLWEILHEELGWVFPYVSLVKSYTSKETHGDMDILVCSQDDEWPDFEEFSFFQNRELVFNGPVRSFGYDLLEGRFQVDLILVPFSTIQAADFYFAYNDLGNLLGRIAHKLGFKLGSKGLEYIVRNPDNSNHVYGTVVVSTVPREIVPFLGYNYNTWSKGFNTTQDIFEFVCSGKYFDKDIYLLENRNATGRIRDKKRKTYTDFLKYCEEETPSPGPGIELENIFEHEGSVRKEELKEAALQLAYKAFPTLLGKVKAINQAVGEAQARQLLVGGKAVSAITGLKDKELGNFMKFFTKLGIPEEKLEYKHKDWINGYISGTRVVWGSLDD